MNSNPYTVPALIVCVTALFGCGAWALLAIIRQPPAGRHARIPGASLEGARFAAELQGLPEPQEEKPVQYAPPETGEPDEPGWWDQQPPQPPAVEILTGPGTSNPQTSAVTISTLATARDAFTLARLRDALLPDAWKPDEPGEATFTQAEACETRADIPAVTGDGAPQYLAAPQ